jgi:spore coat polysaccharide biosynthesis predicted glycosyltransferase SpsG
MSIQNDFKLVNLVVCLSPTIYNQYSRYLDTNKLLIVPNGISLNFPLHDSSIVTNSNKNLICLGKVEPRKKQFELYEVLKDTKINVDFVGPIIDDRVLRLLKSEEKLKKVFLGEKPNTYLNMLFSDYRCLIHVSEAEADALVLYEAQLAGLSIIVTENSIGSQNSELPWIRVIPNNFNLADIEFALSSVAFDKVQVANYARANYGWRKQLKPLIDWLDTV